MKDLLKANQTSPANSQGDSEVGIETGAIPLRSIAVNYTKNSIGDPWVQRFDCDREMIDETSLDNAAQHFGHENGSEESDYDNIDCDDNDDYETVSLLNETIQKEVQLRSRNFVPQNTRPLSLQLDRRPDGQFPNATDYLRQYDRHSLADCNNLPPFAGNDSTVNALAEVRDPQAIVVQVTGGEREEERSWARLKASSRSSSKRSSRAEEENVLNPKAVVKALEPDRIRHISDQNHQQRESPFGYKNWLIHLGQRRRCEIMILVGFLLWLTFFFVLAIFLNGKSPNGENGGDLSTGDDDVIGNEIYGAKNASIANRLLPTEIQLDTLSDTTKAIIFPTTSKSPLRSLNSDKSRLSTTTSLPASTVSLITNSFSEILHDVAKAHPKVDNTIVKTPHSSHTDSASIADDSFTTLPILVTSITNNTLDSQPEPIDPTDSASIADDSFPTLPVPVTSITNNNLDSQPEPIDPTDNVAEKHLVVPEMRIVQSTTSEPEIVGASMGIGDMGVVQYPEETDSVDVTNIIRGKTPNYLIGVGRADVTGPAADVNMMGYANPDQVSGGIHMRQYARAFIFVDRKTNTRTLYVNIDACMASTLLKLEVLTALKLLYGDLYTAENVCISGTHTHSAPGGFLQDVLFQITSWGFVQETLTAMVDGTVESIKRAHDGIQPGYIFLNKGQLMDANINRSPMAYINNPKEERAKYQYDVDKDMTLLKLVDENGQGIGMINWFAVHCTSMNNTNNLISGDNKGYAELLFEQEMDPTSLPGTSKFVAAFAQSNEGDVSPNTRGPHCIDTGESCDNIQSTCNGKVKNCVASGPGKDMFESTKIIGTKQFEKALELYHSATIQINGSVGYVHQYVNMTNYEVVLNNTHKVKTCKPAMGFSFAAGTTDGPGAFNFKQGDKTGANTFWKLVRNLIRNPSTEQVKCHSPKPILLDTGEMFSPYPWQPSTVETQIFHIGQFLIIAVPGEFSTMAGRRVRNNVLKTLHKLNPQTRHEAVIAGLSNTYSDYIVTYEEYQVQRYEGGSTIYGPYTANAYIQQYKKLADMLSNGQHPVQTVHPENNIKHMYSFLPGVFFDSSPLGVSVGDVINDVKESYKVGDVVSVKFIAGNPRNSLRMQPNMTFLVVEKKLPGGSWEIIHTDASWETRYIWKRTSTFTGRSEVTVVWETDTNTSPGTYRIAHQGHYKSMWGGTIYSYSGQSSDFKLEV